MSAEQLRRQRGAIKAKLTATRNFVNRVTDDLESTTGEEVESRVQNLDEAYRKFQNIVQQLQATISEDEYRSKDVAEESEFDDRYFAVRASLLQVLDRLRPLSQASTSSGGVQAPDNALTQILERQTALLQHIAERSADANGSEVLMRILEQQSRMMERIGAPSGAPREHQVRLPIIKLPTFGGQMEDWKRYADTFKTLIHDSDLSNVQKHQYLVGSLSGAAARVIESIEISDQNYTIAWELLKKRYEDGRAIRKRHLQCLFEMPRVQRETAGAIRELIDHVQRHLRVLQAMQLPTESWGEIIIYLIERSLDNVTRRRWEEHAEGLESLSTEAVLEFLQRRCQVLERASMSEVAGESSGKPKFNNFERGGNTQRQPFHLKSQSKTSLSTTVQGDQCCLCQGQHPIYFCDQFSNLSVKDRIQAVKRLRLCINCLRRDHFVANCKAGSCRECGQRHNTLCHQFKEPASAARRAERGSTASAGATENGNASTSSERGSASISEEAWSAGGSSVHHVQRSANRKRILMSTAVVNAKGHNGYNYPLRVLLDSASETNFITLSACKKLGLRLSKTSESINGLGDMSCVVGHSCQLQLSSRTSEFQLDLHCLVVPRISKRLPSFAVDVSRLSIPHNLILADPLFHAPSSIDALIGGEFFLQLLVGGKIELEKDMPILQNSKFGWIIAGSIPECLIVDPSIDQAIINSHTCLSTQESVDDAIARFWEVEDCPGDKHVSMSREERDCESHFVNTMTRDLSGRFIVRLPFKDNKAALGESRGRATERLRCLERKFHNNPEFHRQYCEFMQEYINLNHMSRIVKETSIATPIYLPHHGVLREASITTKLRVVFDGSAKTTSGISLNDVLMVGANSQDNIIDIVLRFRLHAIAITADLKKMYRQILLHPEDRDYQRILWRFSVDEPIVEFELNTVTYGLACAPFLAVRCIRQLASEANGHLSLASQILLNDLYVDDILTGVDTKDDAINLISQLKSLLNSGGFEPHKWRSNCEEILNSVDRVEKPLSVATDACNSSNTKTLGLNWHPERDIFEFSIRSMASSSKTKREVLSAISKLFDPLGLISPILIRAKLIMQATWAANLNWDDQLTDDLQQAWESYVEDLNHIGTIQIPRRVGIKSNARQFNLHAFCDASMKAYGACIYLQTIDITNKTSSSLLCSKSRVAPIKHKTLTLPRLELCGAVLLVRLLQNVKRALKFKFDKICAWSDSTIVLAWISGDPSRQKTFISNRTAEIQSILAPDHWYHVRSEENPADLISRGTNLANLQGCKIWWSGPDWLLEAGDHPPSGARLADLSRDEIRIVESEQRSELQIFLNVDNSNQISYLFLLNNYSSLSKLERILAWILRFINNCKSERSKRKYDCLTVNEINGVRQAMIAEVQASRFANEISDLGAGRPLKSTSKLLSLSPFLDANGLLRVGGRIQNSQASFETKHPILLPGDCRFTRLLFEREHRRLLHAGPQMLLCAIRERYWPMRGKNMARKVVRECVSCFRANPKSLSQIMGQLPADRVVLRRPFLITGIDFAGPIITLVHKGRGRRTNKSYISLFICLSTKAVHLEAVSDLSSGAFIAALRRFAGRRGCPQRILCDNATNFVGARNELHEMQQFVKQQAEKISDEFCVPNNIDWKFIPPFAPHMGGLWEAGIKSCKFHLKRVIGHSLLTFEELTTVLIQIEACLNSRPICQLPSTPTDLQPLTPGHFLVGDSLTSIPEIDLSDVPLNRLDRWQLVQKIKQDFWRRWNREYLTSLQGRTKWKVERSNLAVDDVVLIQDNHLPPLKWKLGRVLETHAGKDDKVRVVTLKTANGICKRAITKICKLPLNDSELTSTYKN